MTTDDERARIVQFLCDVFDASTHGASGLMERAIDAVRDNDMSDPIRIAAPSREHDGVAEVRARLMHAAGKSPMIN